MEKLETQVASLSAIEGFITEGITQLGIPYCLQVFTEFRNAVQRALDLLP